MNCMFCSRPCEKLSTVYYDGGGPAYDRFNCRAHPVKLEYHKNMLDELIHIDYSWEEGDNIYRVYNNIPFKACLIEYSTDTMKDSHGYKRWSNLDLKVLPDFTPDNIKEKCKLYLNLQ